MPRDGFAIIAALVVIAAAAHGQDPGGLRASDYLWESGGALLGGVAVSSGAAVVLGLVGYAVLDLPNPGSDYAFMGAAIGGLVGAALGYPTGCGLGATLAGAKLGVEGNDGGAYVGALVGMGIGALGFFAGDGRVGVAAMGVLAPACAAIGYSAGATKHGGIGARLSLPAVSLRRRSTPEREACTVVDCRLVAMRF